MAGQDFKPAIVRLSWLFSAIVWMTISTQGQGLQLHPENPHYFYWRGKPTILITSGEHYGAVLNLSFDYIKYLNALAADKLNLTRTFVGGAYLEPQGAFSIAENTLAPDPANYIAPWARSDRTGNIHGGKKFDLSQWDAAYFARLRDFVGQASTRHIVVEVNLFCPFYDESQWKISPFNSSNNVNGLARISRTNVYTLDQSGELLTFQDQMVRKVVQELRDFDNVYYEICNEPYFGGVTLDWQNYIANIITVAQRDHPQPKLISQNVANKSARIERPNSQISIFNFHYAAPPETVSLNYHLNKALGDNETGFRGTNSFPYRTEAWDFILAGGALFNNLDYSFTAGHEDGTFVYPSSQPGGGNPEFRKEMRILSDFINSFDFVRMKPETGVIKRKSPNDISVQSLVAGTTSYAMYLHWAKSGEPRAATLELDLPPGRYRLAWVDTRTGIDGRIEDLTHGGGVRTLAVPKFSEDIALKLQRAPE